jgi:hypothetical protein
MVKKTTGFGTMDIETIRAAQLKGAKTRAKNRKLNAQNNTAENQDTAQEGDQPQGNN